jgi:hypothetical protein
MRLEMMMNYKYKYNNIMVEIYIIIVVILIAYYNRGYFLSSPFTLTPINGIWTGAIEFLETSDATSMMLFIDKSNTDTVNCYLLVKVDDTELSNERGTLQLLSRVAEKNITTYNVESSLKLWGGKLTIKHDIQTHKLEVENSESLLAVMYFNPEMSANIN